MRPDILNPLFAETEALKGVGPQLMKPLKKLGLTRIVDLLFHLPTGWIDRKRVERLDEGDVGRVVTIVLTARDYRQSGGPKSPLRIHAADAGGDYMTLVYFRNPGWAKQQLPLGEARLVSGRLDRYGQELQMVHPDHVVGLDEADQLPEREAVYALSEGMTNRRLGELVRQGLAKAGIAQPDSPPAFAGGAGGGSSSSSSATKKEPPPTPPRNRGGESALFGEWIEPSLKAQREWPDWAAALAEVHGQTPLPLAGGAGSAERDRGGAGGQPHPGALAPAPPASGRGEEAARDRLAYDEIFANQLALSLVRASSRRRKGAPLAGDGRLRGMLKLPYEPTGAQRRSSQEIEGDLAQAVPMVRLLQGDVGSGKTLVALHAMLIAVEAGVQAALLAPTEILARQHFETISRQLAGLPVNVAILTGRDKGRVRDSTLMGLADGSIHILIGTHAIFQEAVGYRKLGLAVIDEQHRFGVAQRMMLTAKAERPPHLLVMTATPIPRTLTLTHYGEMDVSRLDEMPPGRQPIETRVLSQERLGEVVDALGRHIGQGKQAYWVCPLVEESEASDLAAAEERFRVLQLRFGDVIGLVHGRMKGPQKDAVMAAFQHGELRVLVATVVIEVGVDVPNATLMVIEHADRFGLAQLHQLRGRVGRGEQQSVCLLLRGERLSETTRARLALMRETNDGFRIAEEDLRLRGAGELLGTRQSGEAGFRLANAEQVQALAQAATDDARLLVDRDGGLDGPRGQAARLLLYLMERDAAVATLRSG